MVVSGGEEGSNKTKQSVNTKSSIIKILENIRVLKKESNASNEKTSKDNIKDCITEMHNKGDFDNVICFSTPLYNNDLYKKFHPDKLSTA